MAAVTLPIEVTFYRPRPLQVVLVGAGGTGARIAPDVARLLSSGDTLTIIDPDMVEERNLARQHFVCGDVGQPKAAVVARRAQMAAPQGVVVKARIMAVTKTVMEEQDVLTLWIGAVDNRATRLMALTYLVSTTSLWVDAGNELRGGQVGLLASSWPAALIRTPGGEGFDLTQWRANHGQLADTWETAVAGTCVETYPLLEAVPQIFRPDPVAEGVTAGCAIRLDTQSLAANVMAYAGVINTVSRFLAGLPITAGVAFFSTANTMETRVFQALAEGQRGHRTLIGITPGWSWARLGAALEAVGISVPSRIRNQVRT